MTRDQAAALGSLYAKRDEQCRRLAELKVDPRPVIFTEFRLAGAMCRIDLPKTYISAQWTVALLDIERRIRAAGGTL